MSIPTRKKWKDLKQAHGVPDGAVSGVDLGQALDKVDKATTAAARGPAVAAFAKAANSYITKLDKKKVREYPKFQKAFLDDYLGPASTELENLKRAANGKELYKSELRKFFQAVQKLDPAKSQSQDLQRFVQFARGMSSVGLRTGGTVETTEINKHLGEIDALNRNMNYKTATQRDLATFITETNRIAKLVAASAKKQQLV